MTVTYVKEAVLSAGSSPHTSSAFTPGAAGNCVPVFINDGSGANITISVSGTDGTYSQVSPPGAFNDSVGDSWNVFANSDCSAVSQTITASGNSGDNMYVIAPEYSGMGSITGISPTTRSSPGTGTNAILGAAQTVPTGGVLIALCMDLANSPSGSITTSGTARGGNNIGGTPVCLAEYAGSADFIIVQMVLSPPSSGGAALAGTPSDATAVTGALATGIDAAGAASDIATAIGTLDEMSLAEWDIGTVELPQLQRRVFSDDGAVKCLAGGNACLVYEIFPVTLGSGTLTIEDQDGAVVFTATTTQMSQGLVISVGETGTGTLTITSFPTGGEYGISWQAAAD